MALQPTVSVESMPFCSTIPFQKAHFCWVSKLWQVTGWIGFGCDCSRQNNCSRRVYFQEGISAADAVYDFRHSWGISTDL